MKPEQHAKSSVKRWGGRIADYIGIHNFLDVSKSAHPDMRHRAILHNALGCYIVERIFGVPLESLRVQAERFGWTEEEQAAIVELMAEARSDASTSFRNSDGHRVQVRDVAEEHIIEDMGRIPTVSDYINGMPFYDWLGGPKRTTRTLKMEMVD